ncbi:cytochrome b/b6 domain-containing protein [Sphingomonas sp. BN140010]|uniref:Cytochrome b/b6 domain-containing protein n=1 Tax=Sphingomonas arvum TaxID=2992113 RepID=A0ABT3JHH3_9SPHN|nr:cytochrome b/b6 domain-containing protein [Sphingomonas sp. BN140010]MCW3798525.1 cytochrome b/b6 domain-containing protein [Sphingomonas sp. BN140010]
MIDAETAHAAAADATLAVPVWDLPVRLFHWSLATLIAFSWWSAEYHHTQWHLWSGYAVLFLLLFRVLWGFVGSSTARFASFVRGPRALFRYLQEAKSWTRIGHTPLGALSVVALLGLTLAQVGFGLILVDEDGVWSGPLNKFVDFDTGELAHSIHEALFNVLLGLIILHVAAILYYRLRGKRLVGAMVRGTAALPAGTEPLVRASTLRLLLALLGAAGLTLWIVLGAPPLRP